MIICIANIVVTIIVTLNFVMCGCICGYGFLFVCDSICNWLDSHNRSQKAWDNLSMLSNKHQKQLYNISYNQTTNPLIDGLRIQDLLRQTHYVEAILDHHLKLLRFSLMHQSKHHIFVNLYLVQTK